MVWQPGLPRDVDAATTRRLVRSLLVVRIARGGMILLFLAIALVAVHLKAWPTGVAVAIALTMLVQLVALVTACRRYALVSREPGRS